MSSSSTKRANASQQATLVSYFVPRTQPAETSISNQLLSNRQAILDYLQAAPKPRRVLCLVCLKHIANGRAADGHACNAVPYQSRTHDPCTQCNRIDNATCDLVPPAYYRAANIVHYY